MTKLAAVCLMVIGVASCQRGAPASQAPAPVAAPVRAGRLALDAGASVQQPASQDGGEDAGPPLLPVEQAMARLVTAMVSNDAAGVLACFSKRRAAWLISTGVDGHTTKLKLTPDAIAKGMKTDGDVWFYFFDDDSELVRGVEGNQHWPRAKGDIFVAPEYAKDPAGAPAGIRWRKEDGTYVIDTIFDSGA